MNKPEKGYTAHMNKDEKVHRFVERTNFCSLTERDSHI